MKQHRFTTRLSDEDLRRLDVCANLARIDRGALIRRLIDNAYAEVVNCALVTPAAAPPAVEPEVTL